MPPKSSSLSRFNPFRKDKGSKDSKKLKKKKDNDSQEGTIASAVVSATSSENIPGTSGDVSQSAQVSRLLPSVEPQSREQAASSIAQSASSIQQPTTAASEVPSPTASPAPTASTPPIPPERLWDLAYDSLKDDEPKLVKAYEKVLSHELEENASSSVASAIEQTNPAIRRSQMSQLVQAGLKKTEKETKVKQDIGNALQVVLSAKDIIGSAIQTVPQAALAWTGVCFALQILVNPTQETKANSEGIIYIISRMNWYWNLSSLLLKENIVDAGSFEGLRSELENRIVDLYKTLLSYQMKSVCSYYRNRSLVILRDIIKLDDWNGNLKIVQDAENAVRKDSDKYNTLQIRFDLEHIATNQERGLRDIYLALQHQDVKQVEREDNQCLKDLRLTNPNDDMTRIEETKGGLLEDSYVWILNHQDFIDWRDGDETRLLWIRGDPGKGKTMLLIGVVKELQKLKSTQDPGLSYFFCQGTDSRLNNATAVLRGLIYQLLVQQQSLISYIREQYDKAGRQLFEDVNAFVALSNIFTKMLHDPRLTRVYLVVDALDECESGLSELLKLIRNVSISSSRAKWLVSSRNRPEIETELRINDSRVELSLELNAESVSGAVDAYIDHKVSELARTKGYNNTLQDQVRDQLHQKANETFLWVALVCKELEKGGKLGCSSVASKSPIRPDTIV